ncbi:MAG: hypothetical protein R3F61_29280 [Myxococcota bacterium]
MQRPLYRFDDEDLVQTELVRPMAPESPRPTGLMWVFVLNAGAAAFAGTWAAAAAGLYLLA